MQNITSIYIYIYIQILKHLLFKGQQPFSYQKERIVTVLEFKVSFGTMKNRVILLRALLSKGGEPSFLLRDNYMYTVSTDVDPVDEYATCFTTIQFLICLKYFSTAKSTRFLSVYNHSICELCSRCAFDALSKPVHDKMTKTLINS